MRPIMLSSALTAAALLAWGGLALAQVHGNPVPELKPAQFVVGVGLEQFHRELRVEDGGSDDWDFRRMTFQVHYGAGEGAMMQGFVALVRAEPEKGDSYDGQEIGVGYRQTVDVKIPAGENGIQTAVLGTVRYGDLGDGDTFNYIQLDLSYGGAFPATKQVDIYGGLLFSEIWGGVGSKSVNSEHNLGLFAGAEFALAQSLLISAELHALHELGIGVLIQYNF